MKILVDTSVIRDSDITEPSERIEEISWGDGKFEYVLPGYEKRKTRDAKEVWRQNQIDRLPTLGRLIRKKKIQVFSSAEIQIELMRGYSGDEFAFDGCEFLEAALPVDRSYFHEMGFDKMVTKGALVDFCKYLLNLNRDQIGNLLRCHVGQKLTGLQKASLQCLDVFRDICHGISESHYPDAFHLWTAEVNKLDYFLLVDKKFQNVMKNQKRAKIRDQPISPSELLTKINVLEIDPPIMEEGVFYTLFGHKIPPQ